MIYVVNTDRIYLSDKYQNVLINLREGDKIFCNHEKSKGHLEYPTIHLINYQSEFDGKISWHWSSPNLNYPFFLNMEKKGISFSLMVSSKLLIDITTSEHREITLKSMGI